MTIILFQWYYVSKKKKYYFNIEVSTFFYISLDLFSCNRREDTVYFYEYQANLLLNVYVTTILLI